MGSDELFNGNGDANFPVNVPFSGSHYDPVFDHSRLHGQMLRIFELIKDGEWRTLREIEEAAHAPASSVSAQLRNLRKKPFGGHTINLRSRGDREKGLYEYQFVVNHRGKVEDPVKHKKVRPRVIQIVTTFRVEGGRPVIQEMLGLLRDQISKLDYQAGIQLSGKMRERVVEIKSHVMRAPSYKEDDVPESPAPG